MPLTGRRHGFSLIEAVVAAAVLLLISAGVTAAVTASLRAEGAETQRGLLEQHVRSELARLGALPYVVPVAPPGPQGYAPGEARSLLQAVFPHASPADDRAAASFTPASAGHDAEFTTVTACTWGTLTTRATFVGCANGAWTPVPASLLCGWAVWRGVIPPGPAVRLAVAASSPSGARSVTISAVLAGDRPLAAASGAAP